MVRQQHSNAKTPVPKSRFRLKVDCTINKTTDEIQFAHYPHLQTLRSRRLLISLVTILLVPFFVVPPVVLWRAIAVILRRAVVLWRAIWLRCTRLTVFHPGSLAVGFAFIGFLSLVALNKACDEVCDAHFWL